MRLHLREGNEDKYRTEVAWVSPSDHGAPIRLPGCIYSYEPQATAHVLVTAEKGVVRYESTLHSCGISVAVIGADESYKPVKVELLVVRFADMVSYIKERCRAIERGALL